MLAAFELKDGASIFVACVTCVVMCYQYRLAKRVEEDRKKEVRRHREEDLIRRLEWILEMTVRYPYLENEIITAHWKENKKSTDIRFMRYDQYCNILFNFLEELYIFYEGDRGEIERFVDVRSWIRMHRQNWENPVSEYENADGYNKDFRNFIGTYL